MALNGHVLYGQVNVGLCSYGQMRVQIFLEAHFNFGCVCYPPLQSCSQTHSFSAMCVINTKQSRVMKQTFSGNEQLVQAYTKSNREISNHDSGCSAKNLTPESLPQSATPDSFPEPTRETGSGCSAIHCTLDSAI